MSKFLRSLGVRGEGRKEDRDLDFSERDITAQASALREDTKARGLDQVKPDQHLPASAR